MNRQEATMIEEKVIIELEEVELGMFEHMCERCVLSGNNELCSKYNEKCKSNKVYVLRILSS